jgi:hypothetical protein
MTSWTTGLSLKPRASRALPGNRAASVPAAARAGRLCLAAAMAAALGASAAAAATDTRPLSAAQIALFETPHLQNITHPVSLEYRFTREGSGGFTDRITENIERIHADGTKYVDFDFLTGTHRVRMPGIDHFHANPLLLVFLQRDVDEMQAATGIPAGLFRHIIREAFVDRAHVSDDTLLIDGKPVPAQRITLQPFAADARFANLPAIRDKTYTFVIAAGVPGMVEELRAEEPDNPSTGMGKLVEQITFAGEKPLAGTPGEQP